ncbi:MAG: hypothetical protein PVG08_08825 [Desulfobacterales bacterium]
MKKQKIEQIEEAPKRIEKRKYGSCMKCGGLDQTRAARGFPICRSCQVKREKINGA